MRFYGICFAVMTILLVILPLLPYGLGETAPLPSLDEEPLLAVVEPQVSATEKTDMLTLAQYPLEKVSLLRIKNQSTGQIDSVALEDFVLGAVCSEMPATFHLEALKAQAVSARTWAVYQKLWQQEHPNLELNGADFQSDPKNWKGYVTKEQAKERFGEQFEAYWSVLTQAVEKTRGQILCYEGEPIAAAYHAISAGNTEAAEYVWGTDLPYLQAVASRGDELAPGYEEQVCVTEKEVQQIFSAIELQGEASSWIEVTKRSPSAYVTELVVGNQIMSGLDFRSALGLRSSCFTVTHGESGFCITTQGYGHGAGLSQYGADFMARQGSSYREILSHYYQETELCSW